MSFGALLRLFRGRSNATQAELAKALGVHQSIVGRWESEEKFPDATRIPEIVRQLALSRDEAASLVDALLLQKGANFTDEATGKISAEALYRKDLRRIPPKLDAEICERLIGEARQGDAQAREVLVCDCLGAVIVYAVRMHRRYDNRVFCEAMELIGFGNALVVEKFDEALSHPNPLGYLRKFAWHEMLHYRKIAECVIVPPTGTPGDDPYVEKRLSTLIDEDGEYMIPLEAHYSAPTKTKRKNYAFLYEALDSLPDRAQALICRLYGLRGHGAESMSEICGGDSTTRAYNALKARKLLYLKKMREYLESQHPLLVQGYTAKGASKPRDLTRIRIPECTMQKLQEAERILRERGATLSMNKLRIESGVNTRYASAYLQRIKENQG